MKRKRTTEASFFQHFLVAALVGQYFWFLAGQLIFFRTITPWTMEQFLLFTGLYGLFLVLHMFSRRLCVLPASTLGYIVVQACLIFALSIVGASGELRQWLFLPLLGELIIFANSIWFAVFAASIMFGFSILQGYIEFGDSSMKVGNFVIDGVLLNVGWYALWWGLGQMPYLCALLLQLWERRRAVGLLNELDAAHRQVTEYAMQVENLTLNAERTRMARELHDTLAQGLTGTILQLEALEAYLEIGEHTKAASIAAKTKQRARAALADSRRAIDDLRTQSLDEIPLIESVQREISRFSEATGISYTLDLPPALLLPEATRAHLLRCISEGLSNIARHAAASHICLSITREGSLLEVQLKDNGVGFNVEAARSLNGHYGLMGMRERARLIGAEFDVRSAIGSGTVIRLRLKDAIIQ